MHRIRRGLRAVHAKLWALPLVCVLAAIALSFLTVGIDRAHHGLIPSALVGTPSSAQTVLSSIATSTMTLATLVLSLTTLAIQLAMGQFSPRIVRALLRDRPSQVAIGLFVGTFAFAMLGLRAIDDRHDFVPGLTVLVTYVLSLSSVISLVLYVHHAGDSLRVSSLIDLVGDETRSQLDRRFPVPEDPAPPDPATIVSKCPGVVIAFDTPRLVALAERAGCMLELVPAMGDFAATGAPLARIHGDGERLDRRAVLRAIELDDERTHGDEPSYGLRKLVDMAERTVREPFNDPTTAVEVIHRLHDCLRLLAGREIPDGRFRDAQGEVRVVARTMSWEGYVRLAFDEIRLVGARTPQVARRLRAALEDLCEVAPPERRPPLERQLELLEAGVRRAYDDEADVAAALTPDAQGIGSGPDTITPVASPNGAAAAMRR
jgi:uncharacterized membrane protein